MHAIVNAILKAGKDKLSGRALIWAITTGLCIAVIFLKERLTPGRLAGIVTIAAGAMVLVANIALVG